ncbi:MAG TPA: hypothetical protein VHR15_12585 [Ktedonobacterales bacterium]|nr:hypothetical protein [Ktedonobacterales bacterium]
MTSRGTLPPESLVDAIPATTERPASGRSTLSSMMATPTIVRMSAATTQRIRIPASALTARQNASEVSGPRLTRARMTWMVGACLIMVLGAVGLGMRAFPGAAANPAPQGFAGRQALSYAQPGGPGFQSQEVAVTSPTTQPTNTPVPKKPTPAPTWLGPDTTGQPCHSANLWAPNVGLWAVPPGCYGTIYTIDPSQYPPAGSTFGYCNWWVNELHRDKPNLLYGSQYRRGSVPVPGAAIYFAGLVQGAGASGHFAQVVAIAPDHYWTLITEMNFAWRGGGFGKVDYRYAHVGSGVTFIYP